MTETNDTKSRGSSGTPRWVTIALLASLMVNMVFVGVAAGRMWVHHHGDGWYSRHKGGGMRGFLRELPEARRSELRDVMRANRAAAREEREKVGALRQAVREAIAREPFDRAALERALSEVNAARQNFRGRIASDFVELVSKMTPEERKLFAEKGLRRDRGGRRHRRGDDM